MAVISTKEFVLSVENQPEAFADITTALATANINVTGFVREGRGDFGVVRLVTDKPDETETMLRAAHQVFRTHEVLSILVPNHPGQLARIAQLLAASGVNVDAAYTTSDKEGETRLTFVLDDLRSAHKVLAQV